MTNRDDRYADWLNDEIGRYGGYHDHKETMAWTATAFYLPAIIGLAYGARAIGLGCPWQIALGAIFPLVAILVLSFLNMQFRMRWKAADVEWGLRRAMALLCARTSPLSPAELEVQEAKHWPKFVEDEIEGARNRARRKCKEFLPPCRFELDARSQSEITSYSAVLLATAIAIAVLWV